MNITIKEETVEYEDNYEPPYCRKLGVSASPGSICLSNNSDIQQANGEYGGAFKYSDISNHVEKFIEPAVFKDDSRPLLDASSSEVHSFNRPRASDKWNNHNGYSENCSISLNQGLIGNEKSICTINAVIGASVNKSESLAGSIKDETMDVQDNEGSVQLDCEELSLSNFSHKVKMEIDMDIIKEEMEDTSVVQTGFEEFNQDLMDSTFTFPRIKKEIHYHKSLSKESSVCETDSDLEESVNALLTTSVKDKAKMLYQTLMNFTTDDGRHIILPFLENPVQEYQPRYYEVVKSPVDMKIIMAKIKSDSYSSLNEVAADFVQMLQNAQKYHEKESPVFIDAEILNGVLHEKLLDIKDSLTHQLPAMALKEMKQLYSAVRFYRDGNQKRLSSAFVKLPLRKHFPDYYEIVKQPIDLELVLSKINSCQYSCLSDVFDDLNLLFSNASRYYEPLSQTYRDALVLQNIAIKKYLEIQMKNDVMMDVGLLVRYMIVSLFNRVFNLQSSKGKYLSNSFSKLPVYEEVESERRCIVSFEVLKYRLDQGFYTRLDSFQNDIFLVFDKARQYSNVDSRLYAYTVTMQKKYLTIRDEIFHHNSLVLLKSRALDFREEDLLKMLDKQRQEKMLPVKRNRSLIAKRIEEGNKEQMVHRLTQDNLTCQTGDFVYLNPPKDEGGFNRICKVLSISTSAIGERIIHGYQYMRAEETHYKPWQKFHENEVFRTERRINISESEVVGKCVVLPEIHYNNSIVENFEEKDVFVCLTRYNSLLKRYSKVKNWFCDVPPSVKLVERDKPRENNLRCLSFPQSFEKRKILLAELESSYTSNTSEQNILKPLDKTIDGHRFYVQYSTPLGIVKLGDFVYVEGSGQQSIIHINRIYVTKEEKKFLVGLRYVPASYIPVSSKGLQQEYKREVYFTATQETHSMDDVVGRCCVFTLKEFLKKRFVEIKEVDVYLCRSHFHEQEHKIMPLQGEIIKYNLPSTVQQDEIYFFVNPLDIDKIEKSDNWDQKCPNKKGKLHKPKGISALEKNAKNHLLIEKNVIKANLPVDKKNQKITVKNSLCVENVTKKDDLPVEKKNNRGHSGMQKNSLKSNLSFKKYSTKTNLSCEKKSTIFKTYGKNVQKAALTAPKKSVCHKTAETRSKKFPQTMKKCNDVLKKKKKFPQKIKILRCSSPGVDLNIKAEPEHAVGRTRFLVLKSKRCLKGKLTRKLIKSKEKPVKLNRENKCSFKLVGGKKPVRAFIHFVVRRRDKLSNEYPYANFNELTIMLATEWAQQSKKSKIGYASQALKMNLKKCDIKNTQIKGYTLFCSEMRKIVRSKYPNAKVGLVTHLLKVEWMHLREKEKINYQTIATLWDVEEEAVDFLGFAEQEKTVTQKGATTIIKREEPNEINSFSHPNDLEVYNQEKIKPKQKYNNNHYFFFQTARFRELKRLFPNSQPSVLYNRAAQEWKEFPKEVKLAFKRRMMEQEAISPKSTQGASRPSVSDDAQNERNQDLFTDDTQQVIKKEKLLTPKGEEPDKLNSATMQESPLFIKKESDPCPKQDFPPPKPPDYFSFNLKTCHVLLTPLGIPLDSKKSFMVNDTQGGFVFLIRPSDHIKYLLDKAIKKEENAHRIKRIKPFLCDKCGKSYRKNDNLVSHMKKHKNSNCLFRCKLCKPRKHFDQNHEFLSHMHEFHGPNWRKKCKSFVSTKDFATQSSLAPSFTNKVENCVSNYADSLLDVPKAISSEQCIEEQTLAEVSLSHASLSPYTCTDSTYSNVEGSSINSDTILSELTCEEQHLSEISLIYPSVSPSSLSESDSFKIRRKLFDEATFCSAQPSDEKNIEAALLGLKLEYSSPASMLSSCFSLKESGNNDHTSATNLSSMLEPSNIKLETDEPTNALQHCYVDKLITTKPFGVASDQKIQSCNELGFAVLSDQLPLSSSIESSGDTITIHSTPSGGIVIDGFEINSLPDKNAGNITVDIGKLECSFPLTFESNNSSDITICSNSLANNILGQSEDTGKVCQAMKSKPSCIKNYKGIEIEGGEISYTQDLSIKHVAKYQSIADSSITDVSEDQTFSECLVLDLYKDNTPDKLNASSMLKKGICIEPSSDDLMNCAPKLNSADIGHSNDSSPMQLTVTPKYSQVTNYVSPSITSVSVAEVHVGVLEPLVENSNSSYCNNSQSPRGCTNAFESHNAVSGKPFLKSESLNIINNSLKDPTNSVPKERQLTVGINNRLDSVIVLPSMMPLYNVNHVNNVIEEKIFTDDITGRMASSILHTDTKHGPVGQYNNSDSVIKNDKFKMGHSIKKVFQKPYFFADSSDNTNVKEKQSSFPCSKCPKIFKKKSDYNKHFFDHSGTATKSFKCHNCNDVFTLVFSKEQYLIWTKRKSKPLCSKCQIPPLNDCGRDMNQ